jgi:hypothetical protein
VNLFRTESSDEKTNAQRNLMGRTHYVDDDGLRFHKSRIISTAIADDGLLFAIVESYAVDYQNTRRAYRPVVFDIFGTVLSRVDLEDGYKSSKSARKAMWDVLNGIDAKAHTLKAIDAQEKRFIEECEEMRAKVRAMGAK